MAGVAFVVLVVIVVEVLPHLVDVLVYCVFGIRGGGWGSRVYTIGTVGSAQILPM